MNNERSSYWDNLKAVLIFLVVLAHYFAAGFIYSGKSGGQWVIPQSIYSFIYMFHMPLFLFVSGYFSKNTERGAKTAVSQLLLPYLIFNLICMVLEWALLDGVFRNPVFYPVSHLWYLAALFLCRVFAGYLVKLRYSWLWALGLSLLCSVFQPGKDIMLLSRFLTFLPFFLLGLETKQEMVEKLRKLPRWLCAGTLLLILGATVTAMGRYGVTVSQLCFLIETYAVGENLPQDLAVTVLRYLLAAVMSICVLVLVPEKEGRWTRLGRNTMPIFLLHNLPGVRNLLYKLCPFPDLMPPSMVWWTLWSVLAVVLLGNSRVMGLYRRAMGAIRAMIPTKKQ